MEPRQLEVGDVVQINPEYDPEHFGGRLLVVTEPKSWGVQGYLHGADKGINLAYLRVKFENIEYVGKAVWVAGG